MCVCVSFGEDKDIDKYENNTETNVEIYKQKKSPNKYIETYVKIQIYKKAPV